MIDKKYIKQRIDEYLEFDSDILLRPTPDTKTPILLIRVFGGAIRDIIAGKEIHDIDILVGSETFNWAKEILKEQGYYYHTHLTTKDIQQMYSDIHVISEPHTMVKNNKVVQLIRPRYLSKRNNSYTSQREYKLNFIQLIQNVDYSCCAVSYDGDNIYQNFPNSILHCQNSVFITNKNAKMYSEKRALHRKYKLEDRGWNEILDNKQIERDEKINNILEEKISVEFVNEIQKLPEEDPFLFSI